MDGRGYFALSLVLKQIVVTFALSKERRRHESNRVRRLSMQVYIVARISIITPENHTVGLRERRSELD